jgi:DNA polymerase-3 subunit alpha
VLEGIDMAGVSLLADINDESVGKSMTFVGVLGGVRRITTKKGDAMLVGVLEDVTSSIEIVVFPKSLAKCGDLLQNDAVLKVTAKVDNRRDSPQLVVDAVVAVEPSLAPAVVEAEMDLEGIGDIAPAAEAPRPVAAEAPHAGVATPPAAAPAPPPPPPPATVVQARSQVKLSSGAGGGNGNGNGKAHAKAGATPASAEVVSAPVFNGRTLRLYLPRSEDYDSDVRRMQDVHNMLLASRGEDQVTLYLPNGVGIVVLQSQHTVSCSAGLLDGLKSVLGPERVALE